MKIFSEILEIWTALVIMITVCAVLLFPLWGGIWLIFWLVS